ncbi:ABC transporter ATP-binding protein/permease [Erythrobacter sp. HL-111]|uniref:ABCB family ABC transporter ATP-binding protein/permease n=1 Tax=Erythrobacter sp. HL-111 TaxID=1798193 RepID=UPI0006DB759F|nr:ABC transporter ATP-binding protein/permease [Erythrobacter sp. HL-111]KPP92954.1 MAG: ATP-binding cassette, subfamily B, bacterial [Erythrobacteraceae bacterium HL-111]SDT03456.1 ATP-binding cassette, subfamily B [Erythrobacter sp. HL-111]
MPPDRPSPSDPREIDGWHLLRRFIPYLWPKDRPDLRWRIVGAMVFVLAAKAVVLALPLAFSNAVDALSEAQGTLGMEGAGFVALALVLAYGLGRFASVLFDNLRKMVFERVGQTATQTLAEDVFHRLHRLSLRFHLGRRTGEVTKVIERGTKSIDMMLYFLLFNIAPTAIELVAVAVIFWTMFGWELVLATAVTVVAYVAVTRWITEWRTKLRREMNDLDGEALHRAVDSLLNYETVKYFGAEDREEARYARSARAYAKAAEKTENSLGMLNIVQAFITNALMAGALAFVVWRWSQGALSVGDLTAVNMYLMQLFRPLDLLGWVYRTIRQGLVDMGQMFRLMDTEIEVKDVPGAPALVVREPSIRFENVTFGYDPGRTILRNLSFEVRTGTTTAIVGPSGAGKSTIGRLLFRFYDPGEGRILIDGQDIARVQQASVRAAIGIVPQDSVLFNDTLGYNIAYGAEGADEAAVREAARGAALTGLIERLPDGLETMVGERGLKLSGGEKQRVAIARTLVKNPPILLLDEATSALDTRTEQEILDTLRRIERGRTTIAIAHRLSTIADADRILVLDQGELAEEGDHVSLLARGGLYAEMWTQQAAERTERAEAAE